VGKDKHSKYLWLCSCSCGGETTVRGNDLRQGKILSCGCFQKETSSLLGYRNKANLIVNPRKGFGEISGKFYSSMRYNALKRGFCFLVSCEFLWNLYLAQEKKCAISNENIPLSLVLTKRL
jgi:hypothetical protein